MDYTDDIITGTASGVMAGVIVSILLWVKSVIDIWMNRRKEIKRLRDIIENYRSRIYGAKAFDFMGFEYTVDIVRRMGFDAMARQLYNALDYGSPNLTYDETQEIRDPLFVYTDLYRDVLSRKKNEDEENERVLLIDTEGYDEIFKKLEELKWLKLSTRTEKER